MCGAWARVKRGWRQGWRSGGGWAQWEGVEVAAFAVTKHCFGERITPQAAYFISVICHCAGGGRGVRSARGGYKQGWPWVFLQDCLPSAVYVIHVLLSGFAARASNSRMFLLLRGHSSNDVLSREKYPREDAKLTYALDTKCQYFDLCKIRSYPIHPGSGLRAKRNAKS